MLIQDTSSRVIDPSLDGGMSNKASDTSIYITDLLGELQTIAKIGGLTSLSDDIELLLVKHRSGQSIL